MQSANTETRQTSAVTVERGHHHELQGRLEKKFAPMDRKLFPPVCLVGRRAFFRCPFSRLFTNDTNDLAIAGRHKNALVSATF